MTQGIVHACAHYTYIAYKYSIHIQHKLDINENLKGSRDHNKK